MFTQLFLKWFTPTVVETKECNTTTAIVMTLINDNELRQSDLNAIIKRVVRIDHDGYSVKYSSLGEIITFGTKHLTAIVDNLIYDGLIKEKYKQHYYKVFKKYIEFKEK